jgi:cytochrome c-type biogenesis protein CcmE
VAIGVVVYQALSSASLYFYNADEAVEQRDDLGEDRFRMQGTVVGEPEETADGIAFDIAYNGERAHIVHDGDPPDLFAPGIPVVLEGRWQGTGADAAFASDRILVKHSEEYEAENPDRIDDARDGGTGGSADDSPPGP